LWVVERINIHSKWSSHTTSILKVPKMLSGEKPWKLVSALLHAVSEPPAGPSDGLWSHHTHWWDVSSPDANDPAAFVAGLAGTLREIDSRSDTRSSVTERQTEIQNQKKLQHSERIWMITDCWNCASAGQGWN
jgi:hypothetical protein